MSIKYVYNHKILKMIIYFYQLCKITINLPLPCCAGDVWTNENTQTVQRKRILTRTLYLWQK